MTNLQFDPRRDDWTWLLLAFQECYGNVEVGYDPSHLWRVRIRAQGQTFVTYGKDIDDALVAMRKTLSELTAKGLSYE